MKCARSDAWLRQSLPTVALVAVLALLWTAAVQACTVFFAYDGRVALAGQNEDWDDSNTQVWSVPKTSETYGVLYFGFGRGQYPVGGIEFSPRVREVMRGRFDLLEALTKDDLYGLPQQGVNEKGLFFGSAQTEAVAGRERPGLPTYDGAIVDLILRRCASVAEARHLLESRRYVLPAGQVLFADAAGDSFILEAGHVVVERTGRHQVMTNFLQSKEPSKKLTDRRYTVVDKGLGAAPTLSEAMAATLLSAAQQSITQYSLVFNLGAGRVSVYRDRKFDDRVELGVQREIAKAPYALMVRDLFASASR